MDDAWRPWRRHVLPQAINHAGEDLALRAWEIEGAGEAFFVRCTADEADKIDRMLRALGAAVEAKTRAAMSEERRAPGWSGGFIP